MTQESRLVAFGQRLATEFKALRLWVQQRTGPVHNLGAYVTGAGLVDETSALQAGLNASPVGSIVSFPPGGVILVSSTIRLPGGRTYQGNGCTIRQVAGANVQGALVAANAWATNADTVDEPVLIQGLTVDGSRASNGASTAAGIVLCNYWSTIKKCLVQNIPGDGILLTDRTADGTNVSNSASENRILRNKIVDVNGAGIRQQSFNTISNQDGFCRDNLISNTGGEGMDFMRASGWALSGNHLYDIQGSAGMRLENCFGTKVQNNYIETFGLGAAGWWVGLSVTVLDGFGVHVTNNLIGAMHARADSTYVLLAVDSGFGSTDAHAIVTGNMLRGEAATSDSQFRGVVLDNRTGGVLHVVYRDNEISNVDIVQYVNPAVVVDTTGSNGAGVGAELFSSSVRSTFVLPPTGVLASAAGTHTRNRLCLIPIDVQRGFTPNAFVYQLGTASAGGAAANVQLCLYDSGPDGWPDCTGGPLAQAPAALTTPAIKTTTATFPALVPGRYWVGGLYTYTTVPTTPPKLFSPTSSVVNLPAPATVSPGTAMRGYGLDGVTTPPTTAQTSWVALTGTDPFTVGLRG